DDRECWLEELARLTDAKEDQEADLAEACRPFLNNRDLLNISGADVQQRLPADTALVDFIQYLHYLPAPPGQGPMVPEPRLGVFVLRRDRPAVYIPLGKVETIGRGVDAWRQAVKDNLNGKQADLDGPAARLAQLVWRPIAEHLGAARTVLIAPEGPLCF